MPQYIIKTVRDRNLVIEADRYNYNATEETYEFFKKTENADTLRVATVPRSPEILAVVQDEVEQADFYYVEDWNDEDEEDIEDGDVYDETCLECQLNEFTQSPTFFESLSSIIDFYHSKDNQEPSLEEEIRIAGLMGHSNLARSSGATRLEDQYVERV